MNDLQKATIVLATLVGYFIILFIISWLASRKSDTNTALTGGHQAPWFIVAIAMIGAPMLHADGAGLCGGLLRDSLCAHALVFQAPSQVDLRLPRGALRGPHPQDRCLVFLCEQDAGCGSTLPGGVREPAAARLRPAAHSIHCQHHHHHCPHLPLHPAGRREDRDMDRHAQEPVPDTLGGAVHRVCGQGPGRRGQHRQQGHRQRHHTHLLPRQPQRGHLLLEAIPGRHLHGHCHDRPRPGPDAAHPGQQKRERVEKGTGGERHRASLRGGPLPHIRIDTCALHPQPRHRYAREGRHPVQPRGLGQGHACDCGHPLCAGLCLGRLLGSRLGPDGAHQLVCGRHPGQRQEAERQAAGQDPQDGAHHHGRHHGPHHPGLLLCQQRQCHQARLRPGQLHLRAHTGALCLRHVQQVDRARQVGARGVHRRARAQLGAAICGQAVLGL